MIDKSASDPHNVTKDETVNMSCWNCFTVENDQDYDTEVTLSQIRKKQRKNFKLYSVLVSEVYQPKVVSTKQKLKDNYVVAKKIEQNIINKINDKENVSTVGNKGEVDTNTPRLETIDHKGLDLPDKNENQDLSSKSINIVTPLNNHSTCENIYDQNFEQKKNHLNSIVKISDSTEKEDIVILPKVPITSLPNPQQTQYNEQCDLSPRALVKETSRDVDAQSLDINECVKMQCHFSPLAVIKSAKAVTGVNLDANESVNIQNNLFQLSTVKEISEEIDKRNQNANKSNTLRHLSPLTVVKDSARVVTGVNLDANESVNIQNNVSQLSTVKEISGKIDKRNQDANKSDNTQRHLSPLAAVKEPTRDVTKVNVDTNESVKIQRHIYPLVTANVTTRGVKMNLDANESIQRRLSPDAAPKKTIGAVDKGNLGVNESVKTQHISSSIAAVKETTRSRKGNINKIDEIKTQRDLPSLDAVKETTKAVDEENLHVIKRVKANTTKKEETVKDEAVEDITTGIKNLSFSDIKANIITKDDKNNKNLINSKSSLKNLSNVGKQNILNKVSVDHTMMPIPIKKRPKYTKDFETSLPVLNVTLRTNTSGNSTETENSIRKSRWGTLDLKYKSSLDDEAYSADVSSPKHGTLPKRSSSPLPHDSDLQLDSHRFNLTKSGGQQNFVRSESMASVYSGAGDGARSSVTVHGEVQISLLYNYRLGALEVGVKRCRELAPVDIKRNRSDPYVKVYLLPDKSKAGKRKTKVKKNTLNPVFEETLSFVQPLASLSARTLWLSVWHADIFGRNDFLGEVTLPLADVVFDDPAPMWYNLHERTEQFDEQQGSRGDLIVALKLDLHESARGKGTLHVLVKEAKNLVATKPNGLADVFCKSYLLPERGRLAKQKTGVCSRTLNPKWEHTFTYRGVTLQELSTRALELSLWDRDRLASNDFMGAIRLSLGTGTYMGAPVNWMDSVGKEVSLWQRMLQQPNFWVENSLPLRPHLNN